MTLCGYARGSLAGADDLRRGLRADRLVVGLEHINHRAADQAGCGLRVDVHGKCKGTYVRVVLYEFNLLDEKRRRLDQGPFGAHQTPCLYVQVDFSLEEPDTFLARLHLVHMNELSVELRLALVRKFVVAGIQGSQRSVVFLEMVDLGLQQASDDIAFDKAIASKAHRFELQISRRREMLLELILAVLRCFRQ